MTVFKSDIKLGERYRDDQTGYEGIATAVYFFQHACERVALEKMNADGNILSEVFDSPRLRHVDTDKVARSKRPGGPAQRSEGRRPGGPR